MHCNKDVCHHRYLSIFSVLRRCMKLTELIYKKLNIIYQAFIICLSILDLPRNPACELWLKKWVSMSHKMNFFFHQGSKRNQPQYDCQPYARQDIYPSQLTLNLNAILCYYIRVVLCCIYILKDISRQTIL